MKVLQSIFGDKEYDFDGAKVVGAILVIVACVGFFRQINGWETMLYSGGAMILGKCLRENT